MHPLLQGIQKRPGMYFGPSPFYGKMVAYIAGYEAARQAGAAHLLAPLLPEDFYEFVCQQFGESSSALGWQGLIARHIMGPRDWHGFMPKNSAQDQAALDLFFELLIAHEQNNQ